MTRDAPQCGRAAVEHMPLLHGPTPYHARRGASANVPAEEHATVPAQHRAMIVMPGPRPAWSTIRRGPSRR
eukprot:10935027-Alexandrium_andersonii.AAC.1